MSALRAWSVLLILVTATGCARPLVVPRSADRQVLVRSHVASMDRVRAATVAAIEDMGGTIVAGADHGHVIAFRLLPAEEGEDRYANIVLVGSESDEEVAVYYRAWTTTFSDADRARVVRLTPSLSSLGERQFYEALDRRLYGGAP